MSASDIATAQLMEIADDIKSMADYRIFPVILESVLFALYAVLMIFHCIKYRKDKGRVLGIFAVSVCLFILCACVWALDMGVLALDLYRLLPSRLLPDGTRTPIAQALTELHGNIHFVRQSCSLIIFILSDSVSLWRACVIYGRPCWLKAMCWSLFWFSCTIYIVDIILETTSFLNSPPKILLRICLLDNSIVPTVVGTMAMVTTAFSQVFAASLIVRIAWIYRQDIQKLLPSYRGFHDSNKRLVAVLYVVIETGVMYSLLWVCFVFSVKGVFGLTGTYWAYYWMCPISGICPTLIVVVVSQRTSLLEQSVINASGLGSTPGMRFAANHNLGASRLSTVISQRPPPELPEDHVICKEP